MALDNWDWFIKLADFANFTKAADSLQISQQALSARLVALEKNLDAKLFSRTTPLKLTPAGRAFLLYAREQQQALQDMLRNIGEVTGSGAGVLKVGISALRSQTLMPLVVKKMAECLPDVSIHLVEGSNRELVRMAEQAEVDAVIARFDGSYPGVELTNLYQEQIMLALKDTLLEQVTNLSCEQACVLIAEQGLVALKNCPFVLGSLDDISGRVAYSVLRNEGIKPKTVATSESMATILAMGEKGIGALFCPSNALDYFGAAEKGLIKVPLSNQATYTISLGIPHKEEPWQVLDVFKQILLDETPSV